MSTSGYLDLTDRIRMKTKDPVPARRSEIAIENDFPNFSESVSQGES